jgi:hypothetical protein
MKNNALDEILGILTAGGRVNNEKSRALESRQYGDPAKNFEFPAERERKKKLQQQQKSQLNFKIKRR